MRAGAGGGGQEVVVAVVGVTVGVTVVVVVVTVVGVSLRKKNGSTTKSACAYKSLPVHTKTMTQQNNI